MIFEPEQNWLPSHGVLDGIPVPSVLQIGVAEDGPVPFVRPFTLAQLSHVADTPAASMQVPRCERGNGANAGSERGCHCCPSTSATRVSSPTNSARCARN